MRARFLRSVGVESLAYGDGLAERLRTRVPSRIDAFIDLFGGGYVELAATLGVARERINTIIDFAGAQKYGVKTDGSSAAASRETLATAANLIAWGEIVMLLTAPIPWRPCATHGVGTSKDSRQDCARSERCDHRAHATAQSDAIGRRPAASLWDSRSTGRSRSPASV